MFDTDSPAFGGAPEFSIVVPCYNEQDSIATLVAEIRACTGDDPRFELLVVDDGSSDDTLTALARCQAEPGVPLRVIVHPQNAGQSAAIVSGVMAARGTRIVTLDGDGQNDPADIARLTDELTQRAGDGRVAMICGYRRARQDTAVRRWSSRIANAVRSRLLGDGTPDTGCGLKAFERDAFLRLPRFDHMHRFLPALMRRDGVEVVSVVVGHRPRRAGVSKYGIHNRLWVGLTDLAGVWWLKRRGFKLQHYEER